MMMRYKKMYFLLLIVLLFIISAGASLILLNKNQELLLWNERASGRSLMQLVILQQSYLNLMLQHQRGDDVSEQLLTSYDLTWSAYQSLLKGSKNAYFISEGQRINRLKYFFTLFKENDPTQVNLTGEQLNTALYNTQEAHNYSLELLNHEFQGYSRMTHQRNLESVRVNEIMIIGLIGLTFSGTIFLLIILRERRKMTYLAFHDPLTELANRTALKEKVTELQNNKISFYTLLIDIDRFKAVNDNFGHDVGDKLLIYLSDEMAKICGELEFVARLGGDEFTIICYSKKAAEKIALKLLDITKNTINIKEKNCDIGMSIGISFSKSKHKAWVDIFKEADVAMYQAKEKGGDDYHIYEPVPVSNRQLNLQLPT
jgi:diguanylate cyclase